MVFASPRAGVPRLALALVATVIVLARTPALLFSAPPAYYAGNRRPLPGINTKWAEAEMTFADDGTIVFTSNRPDKALAPGDVFDLYIAHPTRDGSYTEPMNMGPLINSVPDTTGATPRDGDDREPFLTPDGNTLYFKSTRLATFDSPPSLDPNSIVAAGPDVKIFVTRKVVLPLDNTLPHECAAVVTTRPRVASGQRRVDRTRATACADQHARRSGTLPDRARQDLVLRLRASGRLRRLRPVLLADGG